MQRTDFLGKLLHGNAHLQRQLVTTGMIVGKEFVQRRIEKPNRRRPSGKGFVDSLEIATLHRKQLIKRFFTFDRVSRQDHPSHRKDSTFTEEHMFSPAEPDSLGTEENRHPSVLGSVRVGVDRHALDLLDVRHELLVEPEEL